MSQENVELVRSMYRPGDPSRFFDLLYDEVEAEFDASAAPLLPDYPQRIRGKNAVVDFYRHWWGTWDDYVLEPTEIIDAGEDRVVVVHHERGTGKGSGAPFERRWGIVYTLRSNQVLRVRFFTTREDALEAAGLSDGWKSSHDRRRERAMSLTFPGESAEYREARDRLLEQEIELRREMEAVAAARRQLPPGGVVPEDYVFQGKAADGNPADVRMSELFAPGKDSLVIYNFMFPRAYGGDRPGPTSGETALLPLEEGPCPSCVALLDQLDGAAEHASQQINFAVVAKTPLSRLLTWGEERGWRKLRLLSSAANTYNRDYFGEAADGSQFPMLNVFHRDGGTIRHFWGAELTFAPADPGEDHRSVGTLEPLWNLFDLTREGRPDWDERLSY